MREGGRKGGREGDGERERERERERDRERQREAGRQTEVGAAKNEGKILIIHSYPQWTSGLLGVFSQKWSEGKFYYQEETVSLLNHIIYI